jgi:hypothetical protein
MAQAGLTARDGLRREWIAHETRDRHREALLVWRQRATSLNPSSNHDEGSRDVG